MFTLKLNETCFGRKWATSVLQQFPEREKNTIWQASKAKQAKSFQITLEILKKNDTIRSYGLKL